MNTSSIDEHINNRQWAQRMEYETPGFHQRWRSKTKVHGIGCSDSRVPANQISENLEPGEVFVHRNVGQR